MEQAKTSKNLNNNLEEDDDSVNINKVDEKIKTKKISFNTLATNHFDNSWNSNIQSEYKKVSSFIYYYVTIVFCLLTSLFF